MKQIKQQPLYLQVKQELMHRVADKSWIPGEMIPNENQLAEEFGVSQGTVRRALDEMMEERLIFRKQGVGTFIAEETVSSALKNFFKIEMDDAAKKGYPTNDTLSVTVDKPNPEETTTLQLTNNAQVTRILRVRSLEGVKKILEYISIPTALFTDIEKIKPLPDALYPLFQARFQTRIGTANDMIKAVVATEEQARYLGVAPAHPLLYVHRVSYDLHRRPIELRKSYCNTDGCSYRVVLS